MLLPKNYKAKGQLVDIPRINIEKMLEYQVKQGNKLDVSVFEKYRKASVDEGGFDWYGTKEGFEFWFKLLKD